MSLRLRVQPEGPPIIEDDGGVFPFSGEGDMPPPILLRKDKNEDKEEGVKVGMLDEKQNQLNDRPRTGSKCPM